MPLRNQFRAHPITIAFTAYGVDVAITVGDPSLRAEVNELLPPSATPKAPAAGDARFALTPTPDGAFDVIAGTESVQRDAARDLALGLLDSRVRLHIAEHAPKHVFVHAGVIARDGRALAIPGESFSGKTTLVTALLAAGADYLSDEYAVLDPDGHVHPYPRRLSIRPAAGQNGAERHASELNATTAAEPCQLAGVIITRYSPGADWQPTAVTRGRGCLAMLEHTVPARSRPQAALDAIDRALAGATILAGDRGDATDTARRIMQRLPWLRGGAEL
jgi:hypothetical protein